MATDRLGKELNARLQMVFMGFWEPYEMPYVLEEQGLLRPDEIDDLFEMVGGFEEHYGPKLRVRVQQAYREYYHDNRRH